MSLNKNNDRARWGLAILGAATFAIFAFWKAQEHRKNPDSSASAPAQTPPSAQNDPTRQTQGAGQSNASAPMNTSDNAVDRSASNAASESGAGTGVGSGASATAGLGIAAGAPSMPSGTAAPATTAVTAVAKQEKPAPRTGCYSLTFSHAKNPDHGDGEPCLLHDNEVSIADADATTNGVCAEVNGRPVSHRVSKAGGALKVAFGPHAGPRAEVKISYCIAGSRLARDCKVPKDEFLAALGADGEDGAQAGAWDTDADAQAEKEISKWKNELKDGANLFRGWVAAGSPVTTASAPAAEVSQKSARKVASAQQRKR